MVRRKYRVAAREDVRGRSHASWLFPECLYTLERQEDGKIFKVTLSKALGWKPGDVVDVEDLLVEGVRY